MHKKISRNLYESTFSFWFPTSTLCTHVACDDVLQLCLCVIINKAHFISSSYWECTIFLHPPLPCSPHLIAHVWDTKSEVSVSWQTAVIGMQATSHEVVCVAVYCRCLNVGNPTHSCQKAKTNHSLCTRAQTQSIRFSRVATRAFIFWTMVALLYIMCSTMQM
jgi:hypothetical protein